MKLRVPTLFAWDTCLAVSMFHVAAGIQTQSLNLSIKIFIMNYIVWLLVKKTKKHVRFREKYYNFV